MVWSEDTPYPFNVYDLFGSLIMTVDITGITLYSPGTLDVLVRMGQLDSPNFSGYGLSVIDSTFDLVESVIEASGLRVYSLPPARQFSSSGALLFGNPAGLQDDERPYALLVAPRLGNHQPWIQVEAQSYDLSKDSVIRYSNTGDATFNDMTHEFQGYSYVGRYVASVWTRETWKNMTLPGGWVSAQPVQYRLGPDGFVTLRGIAQAPGVIAAGTVITTLPADYRPAQTCYFPQVYDSGAGIARCLIRANGNVELYEPVSVYPCFDGMRFAVTGLN